MEGGYKDMWMNEEDNNAFGPLTDVNYFHVDVQERIHHELNGAFEKKRVFNAKIASCFKRKNEKWEWLLNFLAFEVFL
jgi:hypothetical protein